LDYLAHHAHELAARRERLHIVFMIGNFDIRRLFSPSVAVERDPLPLIQTSDHM